MKRRTVSFNLKEEVFNENQFESNYKENSLHTIVGSIQEDPNSSFEKHYADL